MKESVDVFIAYHLGKSASDERESSYKYALTIKKWIEESGYTCFLREPFDSTQSYQDTREIAQCSKLFLAVINKYVDNKCDNLKQGNGVNIRVLSHRCYIYEELQGFLTQFGGRASGEAKGKIQCYCCDKELSDAKVGNLHIAFAQMVPIREKELLLKWIEGKLIELQNERKAVDIPHDEDVEWNSTLADVWRNIYPPSRPSKSEIECYRRYFKKVMHNAKGDQPSVLILGSTKEFRILAAEEGFNAVVVDYNKDYYDEISKEIPDEVLKREKLFVCEWSNMADSNKLHHNQFDIIIGDLAIGNIKPNRLKATIKAISNLIRSNGYFLGKNLYSFSRDDINDVVVQQTIEDYFNETMEDTCENAYASTMYNLAIYATRERNNKKINFLDIYKTVHDKCVKLGKENSALYEVYCGNKTSFKEKMELSFYTYPLSEVVKLIGEDMYFSDTVYGKDSYSHKFPLMVFKKLGEDDFNPNRQKHNCFRKIKNHLVRMSSKEYVVEWADHISAQYFLVKLSEIFTEMGQNNWKNILLRIKKQIINTIKINVSPDLCCYIESYYDEKIDKETSNIRNFAGLADDQEQLVRETYTLAVLVYLTFSLFKDYESLYKLVEKEIFSLPEKGDIWCSDNVPWVRAKICLSIKNIYPTLSVDCKKLVNETIGWIINNYDKNLSDWKCDVGSRVDNRALCCEVLISYYSLEENNLDKDSIMHILGHILNSYVKEGKLYETCAIYPIGEHVIQEIIEDGTLRGNLYSRKLTGRVEFLTILLRIINFVKANKEDYIKIMKEDIELEHEEVFLTRRLVEFWDLFEKNEEKIRKQLNESEISAIPQIIYSLAEAFKQ